MYMALWTLAADAPVNAEVAKALSGVFTTLATILGVAGGGVAIWNVIQAFMKYQDNDGQSARSNIVNAIGGVGIIILAPIVANVPNWLGLKA